MQFTILSEKEFEKAALTLPCSNFHQTIEWGKLKETNGWKPFYLGIKEKKEIIAATLLLKKKIIKNQCIFYAPRGYLLDFKNQELLDFFTQEIKKFAKKEKAIFVKIDPYLINKERNIDGKIIESGIDNSEIITNLKKLGYKHTGFNLKYENIQPRWAFAIDLENKTEEEVFENMESKTRQLIRKNERNNIEIREIDEEELAIFKDIMSHTSERRGFIDRPFSYYKNMLEILKDKAKIYIAELNIQELLEKTKEEIENNKKIIETKENEISNKNKNINIEKTKRKIEELIITNKKLDEKAINYQKIIDKDGKRIVLGGIIYMIYNTEILSLFGGCYEKYKEFLSFYTIHWELIKYAIKNGYKKYNFYGISGDFENKNDELYGLYDFKRGFGGNVEEYIGEFDLIINKPLYLLYQNGYKTYKKIKNKNK